MILNAVDGFLQVIAFDWDINSMRFRSLADTLGREKPPE